MAREIIRRLRETRPWLTPPWAPGDKRPLLRTSIASVSDASSRPVLRRSSETLSSLPRTEIITRPTQPLMGLSSPSTEIMTRPLPPLIGSFRSPDGGPPDQALMNADTAGPMPVFNNKGRPTGVEGGGDPLAQQQVLLREQQNYNAPRSKKDMALQALFGFLQGGIPGAVGNVAQYAGSQDYRNQVVMGRDITNTENQINRNVILRNQESDLQYDKSLRAYRDAQTQELMRRPDIEANKAAEQHRRTLTTLYNRLPEFNPEDPANADLVQAMTEAGLPVVPKSRANQLRFVQDARTGEWRVISGNRVTGEAVGRAVEAEGKTLATTPTSQIASEDREAGRASREGIAAANRRSREGIAATNQRGRVLRRPYIGRVMSASAVEAWAKERGITDLNEAKRILRNEKIIIQ